MTVLDRFGIAEGMKTPHLQTLQTLQATLLIKTCNWDSAYIRPGIEHL